MLDDSGAIQRGTDKVLPLPPSCQTGEMTTKHPTSIDIRRTTDSGLCLFLLCSVSRHIFVLRHGKVFHICTMYTHKDVI